MFLLDLNKLQPGDVILEKGNGSPRAWYIDVLEAAREAELTFVMS